MPGGAARRGEGGANGKVPRVEGGTMRAGHVSMIWGTRERERCIHAYNLKIGAGASEWEGATWRERRG